MGRELARRIDARLRESGWNVTSASLQAHLSKNTIRNILKNPDAPVKKATCDKLAVLFEWPPRDVYAWAELNPPDDEPGDPIADLHSALYRGWPSELAGALYKVALAARPAAPAHWRARAQMALAEARKEVEHWAADKGGPMAADELADLYEERFWKRFNGGLNGDVGEAAASG